MPCGALEDSCRYLVEEKRALSGIALAYGDARRDKTLCWGLAREVRMAGGAFVADPAPVTYDTLFDLASVTKLFTAVALLRLAGRGRLSLDAPLARVAPQFRALSDVPIGEIACYRAHIQTPARVDAQPTREAALAQVFRAARSMETPAKHYSDMNALVLKYAVEGAADMPFFEVLAQEILRPLGMVNTFAHVPEASRARCADYNYERRVHGHEYTLRTDAPPGTAHDPKAAILSDGGRDLCGHAGLFTTLGDAVLFARGLLSGALLPRDTLRAMAVNRTGYPVPHGYVQYLGFLCYVKHPIQQHSEVPAHMSAETVAMGGFTGNHISVDPVTGRYTVMLANRVHNRVTSLTPAPGKAAEDYGLAPDGTGAVPWPDGHAYASSVRYVYQRDAWIHAPIAKELDA